MEVGQSSLQACDLSSVFEKHLEEEECEGDKSEVDTYLEEAREKIHGNTKFEILSWWKQIRLGILFFLKFHGIF